MVGTLLIGDQLRQTRIRFRKAIKYEAYFNSIGEGYDAEDAVFNGYYYKNKTLQFIVVNRAKYGSGCNFKHQIFEYRVDNCYIPSNGYCFSKFINFLSCIGYKQQCLGFIRNEKRRSNIMTMARIQPCLRKIGVNLGYYNGREKWLGNITESKKALKLHINHSCLIWKNENFSFNQTIKELKYNYNLFDNYTTEKNDESQFE